MILLIRNLDRSITKDALLALLSKFGRVLSCDLVLDQQTGQSKGFAFAEFQSAAQATVAIKELNGKKLGSLALRVKRAANSSVKKNPNR